MVSIEKVARIVDRNPELIRSVDVTRREIHIEYNDRSSETLNLWYYSQVLGIPMYELYQELIS